MVPQRVDDDSTADDARPADQPAAVPRRAGAAVRRRARRRGSDALAAPRAAFGATTRARRSSRSTGAPGRHRDRPAQDRLLFAAFDVSPTPRRPRRAAARMDGRAARMTVGRPVARRHDDPVAPPDDTGEAIGLTPARPHGHVRIRRRRSSTGRRPLRPRRATPAALVDLPAFPGDALDPPAAAATWRAGVRERPAGRVPRDPQPHPHRARHGGAALVAGGLRPDVVDEPRRRRRATSWGSRTARTT